jgi:hypothetical protein
VFFYRCTSDLLAECFVPPVTSMSKSPWIPLLTGLLFQGFASVMTLALPETLPMKVSEQESSVINNTLPEPQRQMKSQSMEMNVRRMRNGKIGFVKQENHSRL